MASKPTRTSEGSDVQIRMHAKRNTTNAAGFGMFKIALQDVLTLTIILELATIFEYPNALIDQLRHAKDGVLFMVTCMEERGQIKSTNITPLLSALRTRNLYGIAETVERLFQKYLPKADAIGGFGRFKIDLSEQLSNESIEKLATLLNFKPAIIEKVTGNSIEFVNCLEQKGIIGEDNIDEFLAVLADADLLGVARKVKTSFERNQLGRRNAASDISSFYPGRGTQDDTGERTRERDDLLGHHDQGPTDQELKKLLTRQLKDTYRQLYDKIQPIPYIRDKLYSVDKVFVEVGVESKTEDGHDNWETIASYNDIFKKAKAESKLQIIEGDPGYGKSTLALQLVYDWCNDVPGSSLENIDILIFLNLRQLGGVKSIYKAILQLLPRDTTIKKTDVVEIMRNSHFSRLVVFDAYDEYPDQNDDDTDMALIIRRMMFQDVHIILTTRTSYIPPGCGTLAGRIRLTGFGERAREQYVRKAVAGDDEEAVKKIMSQFKTNPILGDICQAPLFFVMYAHLSHEEENVKDFQSVTEFFRYMIACFHNHMQNKMSGSEKDRLRNYEREHHRMDKIAFDGLTGKSQQIVWDKKFIVKKLGEGFYKLYINIGILVEEDVLDRNFGLLGRQSMQYKTEVRFYHKLFCEWYAAHHLVRKVKSVWSWLWDFSKNIDPFDLQFVYRFACGLDPSAASTIVNLVRKKNDGDKFAVLCALEQNGNIRDVLGIVRNLVSQGVHIAAGDSKLLQRTTVQLLELASRNKISVPYLQLHACIDRTDATTGSMILKSGVSLPGISTVERIEVHEHEDKTMTETELEAMLHFAQSCTMLKEIILNLYLEKDAFVSMTVSLTSGDNFNGNLQLRVGMSGGYENLEEKVKEPILFDSSTDALEQAFSMVYLRIASANHISIPCLQLNSCIDRADVTTGSIILTSGLSLPRISTLRRIEVHENKDRIFAGKELQALLKFVQTCTMLEEIILKIDDLPASIPKEALKLKVSLISDDNFHSHFRLKVGTTGEYKSIEQKLLAKISIDDRTDMLEQLSTILCLRVASYNHTLTSKLKLEKSYASVDVDGVSIMLHSGLCLPQLSSVKKLEIWTEWGREITIDELTGIMNYARYSQNLREVIFVYCLLPQSADALPRLEDGQVFWCTRCYAGSFLLESGRWKATSGKYMGKMLTDADYTEVVKTFREIYRDKPWQKTRVAKDSGKK